MNYKKLAVLAPVILGCGLLVVCGKSMNSLDKPGSSPGESGAISSQTEAALETEAETTVPAYEYEIRELPEPKYLEPAEHFAGGTGIPGDPYQIADAAQLALMAERINGAESVKTYGGAHYILTADIALNDVSDFETWSEQGPEYSWEPIGNGTAATTFSGDFDGDGFTISGLYINENHEDDPYAAAYGLFGKVSGKVHDLTLDQSSIAVSGYTSEVGGITGSLADTGIIDKCTSNVNIVCYDSHCGGIAGKIEGGYVVGMDYGEEELPTYSVIRNCRFGGTIRQIKDDSRSFIGGIAGSGNGHIVSCTSKGTIRFGSADADSVGGIISMLHDGMIAGCEHTGTMECRIEGDSWSADVGGIAGNLYLSSIGSDQYMSRGILVRNCKNSGVVSGKGYAGGIAGNASNDNNDWCLSIESCVNQGTVSGGEFAGGIVGTMSCAGDTGRGSNLTLQDCSNTADLTGGNVGGIAGQFQSTSGATLVRNCDNFGTITAESQHGAGILAYWVMDGAPDIRVLVEDCDNSGTIVSELNAGGIFSMIDQPVELKSPTETAVVIRTCKNSGEVKTSSDNSFIGGIMGSIGLRWIPVVVTSCTNTGGLFLMNEQPDEETLQAENAFPVFRIVGGIAGRVGSGLFLTTNDLQSSEAERVDESQGRVSESADDSQGSGAGSRDDSGDSDAESAANLQTDVRKITITGCKSTGKLHVADSEESVNANDEQIYQNWFGGIIGNLVQEEGSFVLVSNCSYKHFERGLGNEDIHDIGSKIE